MPGGDRDKEFREYVLGDRTRLMRTAMLLTAGDQHTAEDLVQTTLTKVYVHWRRIMYEGAGPYAHRILVNTFLDGRRRASRRPEVITADIIEPRPDGVADVDELLTVRRALLDLAPRQRAVVVLRFFEDMDVAQAARVLECSEGTVKSQTAKALRRLRAVMADPATETGPGKPAGPGTLTGRG